MLTLAELLAKMDALLHHAQEFALETEEHVRAALGREVRRPNPGRQTGADKAAAQAT